MIYAEVTVDNDSYGPIVEFDATPWFEQARKLDIELLRADEYFAGEVSDEVAEFCADGNETLSEFFRYVYFRQRHSRGSDSGFSCRVSEKDAEAWIAENRPSMAIGAA